MNFDVNLGQEQSVRDWFSKYRWKGNPFSFKIYEQIMVGNREKIEELVKNVEAHNAFSIVVGETGAGKTNLLKWLYMHYRNTYSIYFLPKPPGKIEGLIDFFSSVVLKQGFLAKKFAPLTQNNLHQKLQNKLKTKTVIILDEGHEAPIEVLAWIRAIIDHVDSIIFITAGIPELIELLQTKIPTLYSRAPSVLFLEALDKDETIDLIRKRIELVGGSGVEPFTYDVLVKIFELSGGFPREILRLCHQCIIFAIRKNRQIIDIEVLNAVYSSNKDTIQKFQKTREPSKEIQDNLSERQQELLEYLISLKEASPTEIINLIDTTPYQSKSHALRSINNVLVRMMKNQIVDRKRKGRTYIYYVKNLPSRIQST